MLVVERTSILWHKFSKHTYICNLHFVEAIEENPDPILATSLAERTVKREKNEKESNWSPRKKSGEYC